MEATILPNGKVLVDGGSAKDEDATTASLQAEIYDPATNSFSSAGSNAFPRLYHNVQLLLPDATVALSGGNPEQGVFENHIEIYQPSYLFNPDGSLATRPRIAAGAPGSITYAPVVQRAYSGRQRHRVRGTHESRLGDALIRYGPALCRLDVHSRTDCRHTHRNGSAGFEHCTSRLLHALPRKQGRHAFSRGLGTGFGLRCSSCECSIPHRANTDTPVHHSTQARNRVRSADA